MDAKTAYGIVLRKYRIKATKTQEQLASDCNLDRTYISMLERGIHNPSLESLFSIALNLGINASEMIREVEFIVGQNSSEDF